MRVFGPTLIAVASAPVPIKKAHQLLVWAEKCASRVLVNLWRTSSFLLGSAKMRTMSESTVNV